MRREGGRRNSSCTDRGPALLVGRACGPKVPLCARCGAGKHVSGERRLARRAAMRVVRTASPRPQHGEKTPCCSGCATWLARWLARQGTRSECGTVAYIVLAIDVTIFRSMELTPVVHVAHRIVGFRDLVSLIQSLVVNCLWRSALQACKL